MYDVNQEPLVTSKATFDIFLKQENPSELIALYHFYYYTAKWQKTNKVKATTAYVANGLKWSQDRVRRTKKTLIELGFIEDVKTKDEKTKSITGHYIKINFIWTKSHPHENPEYGLSQSMENLETNAYSINTSINTFTNNKNALREDNNKKRIRNLFPQNIKISQFDEFWKLYPRKVDKGKALTIWKRLANKKDSPNWTDIKNALQEQIDTDRWKTPKFIPHPATWLNQSRWLDDPSEMKSYSREDEKPVSGYTDSEPLKYKTARKV